MQHVKRLGGGGGGGVRDKSCECVAAHKLERLEQTRPHSLLQGFYPELHTDVQCLLLFAEGRDARDKSLVGKY